MINKSILKEGKVRFLSGNLADFSRLGTLFNGLLIAHLIALIWLFGIHRLTLEEALAYFPGFEITLLINAVITLLIARRFGTARPRILKLLRYGLNLVLPALNILCFDALLTLAPFLPEPTPYQVWLYSTFIIWLIFLILECQHARLTPSLAEARLQALQNRIHPHFLFNSLNSVLALIRHQPEQAEHLLEDMCELFHAVLHDHHATVTLEEELNWCQRYLNIEHARLGERLNVIWTRPPNLPAIHVPPLLIQPLVENAVYHGISLLAAPGTLHIDVRIDKNHLHLRIENPLPNRSAAHSGHRLALDNIQQRLALSFGGEAYLNTHATSDRFTTELVLPLPRSEP